MNTFYLKYVPYAKIPEWEAVGWRVADPNKPSHHCYYAKIMKWEGSGDPIIPNEDTAPGATRPKKSA